MIHVLESASSADRLRAAAQVHASATPGTEILIVGASRDAVDDLVRAVSDRGSATFGLHRFTLTQLAARLAAPELAARGLATCTRLGAEAVAARTTFAALAGDRIPFFTPVARCPGFGRALAATVAELRAAGVGPQALAAQPPLDQLGVLLAAYEDQLARARLADRAILLRVAADEIARPGADPLVGLPLLLVDVPIETRIERALVTGLCAAAPRVLAAIPSGDRRTREALSADAVPVSLGPTDQRSSLSRLQRYLFNEAEEPPLERADDAVRFFSAPGEGRETVEIARAILGEARSGTPFDRMAVFLRSPETYTALLETALRRAAVPSYFARGTRRPHPSGRAFLAVLACAAEHLSASRFAEYLSFAQVPVLGNDGAPLHRSVWRGPRDDAFGAAAVDEPLELTEAEPDPIADGDAAPMGALRAPWRWEKLLIDAAVIGGADRWARRLTGLDRELRLRRAEVAREDAESPRLAALDRELVNLEHLRRFALPVIDRLGALPHSGTWGEWLERLAALAPQVLRRPEAVLQVLAELAPMAEVGPVGIDEVRGVLGERLSFLTDDPPKYRYGRVLVTTLDDARARSFDVVFVPGLAERIFPQPPREDPLLLDAARAELSDDLPRQRDRIERERLLLRLAVGAAVRRVYLSYPRVDVVQGRARVTSFYGLDVARATRGRIPALEAFEREAASLVNARLGWPAPVSPADAIDAAEHDLAILAALLAPGGAGEKGSAQYLLELNPHLSRSLRTRYARWEIRRWSEFDGIVRATPSTAPLLAAQRLSARPYAPSALEQFAICPYRFYLSAILRLEPRTAIAPLEQLDPLTRGRLVHRVQAETLRALAAAGALPVTASSLGEAERVLADTLDTVAAQFYDEVAPPILRVWQDELTALRGDLLLWLRHLAQHGDTWHPAWFELGFGVPRDASRDPSSRREPVVLAGGMQLRGAVDLVERRADGAALRVTDHKTGADHTPAALLVGGGEILQPVLYALAVEAALGTPVVEGRLFFCTARGGFGEHVVRIDEHAHAAKHTALTTIDAAIAAGRLPPAPRKAKPNQRRSTCDLCDFRPVCGSHEEERLQKKEQQPLAALAALRQLR